MGTIVVTGSASGIGAATTERLEKDGHRVIGVDRHAAEIVADLGSVEGRGPMRSPRSKAPQMDASTESSPQRD